MANNDTEASPNSNAHLTLIIGILAGVLATVFFGVIGIVIYFCFCRKKKNGDVENQRNKSSDASKTRKNSTNKDDAFKSTTVGSKMVSANRQSYGSVASIFASAPKAEPEAPRKASMRKKKVKLIDTKNKPKNYYMKDEQESSVCDSKENVVVADSKPPPPAPVSPGPSLFSLPPTSSPAPNTAQSDKPIVPETNTDYEEAEKKTIEYVEDPHHIAGLRARGPLAPDHIPAKKFKHRGNLIIKKRSKLDLKHELENDPHVNPKSTDRVQFDSQMNEVVDFGPGVEHIISNKSTMNSISPAVSTPKVSDKTLNNSSGNGTQQLSDVAPPSSDAAGINSKKTIKDLQEMEDKTQRED